MESGLQPESGREQPGGWGRSPITVVMRILFACVANSCRSQMAEAFCRELGDGIECASAGSHPGHGVHAGAQQAMAELGIDISGQRAKGFAELRDRRFDYFISMGCGDSCPFWPGAKVLRWDIPDT